MTSATHVEKPGLKTHICAAQLSEICVRTESRIYYSLPTMLVTINLGVIILYSLGRLADTRLVVREEDLDNVDSDMIKEEATIVDEYSRETGCPGVKVF